jgi:hypothetical protein
MVPLKPANISDLAFRWEHTRLGIDGIDLAQRSALLLRLPCAVRRFLLAL